MGQTRYRSAAPLAALGVLLAVARAVPAQDVATQRQSERTEQANREATVADEASKPQSARAPAAGAHTSPATLSYGPVLTPRGQQGADAVRKDSAEVHDEADTLARQGAHPQDTQLTDNERSDRRGGLQGAARAGQHADRAGGKADGKHGDTAASQRGDQAAKPTDEQRRRAARRHPAWQPTGPMAPRPLRAGESPATTDAVPIPPPFTPPQPVVPSSSAVRACQGIVCTDAAGNAFNGSGNAGVGSGGRTCTRTGATVQCF
ncbi:hypothetical protein HAV22_14865 [Massilia sp. TW-1]|uniref:Secreted protein n=1 Tax=Telluria antibiotica TaxID=2717319 RepID=A0ABX0PDL6_9BURK|nr:hypothetical protein [Telluria antibiotica]NIA54917.1 hypothetical protein [Telluria antibiotica]